MDGPSTNPAAPLDPRSTTEFSVRSIHQSPQALPPSPAPAEESPDHFRGWKTLDEQGLYDEEGFQYPSCNLTSEKLKDRKEDDVVIFNYSLSRADGNPVERGGPSSRNFGEDDDIFFQVPKDTLIGSGQFHQAINPEEEPRLIQSRERLAIIDFPQCYDTRDDNLLNSMAKELHLPNPATFGDAHSKRVLTLPGRGRFRTGFSLRVPPKYPSELAKSGSSENRITLFVSLPYFGKSSTGIPLGPESESVELLDFKHLGVDAPDRSSLVSEGDKDDLREILVHQARYMIFDNHTMATFRSKEDSAKDQVPLHRFQELIGAFHAMIQMIANHMGSEVWILGKLQASLSKLEQDIDQMISDAETYEDDQGMKAIPDDEPLQLKLPPGLNLTEAEAYEWKVHYNRCRQNKIQKRKQRRVRHLLTALNRLSAALFAAIAVAERQIAVLHDLHNLFSTSYQTKAKGHEKKYPLRRNLFCKNIAPIPIFLENSKQIWPNALDTIDEVIRERKYFIEKVKQLEENLDIRRRFLSVFLKSDHVKVAPSKSTAQDTTDAIKRTEDTLMLFGGQLVQQGHAVDSFTFIAIVFLPLNFCASYFGMQTVKEFGGSTAKMSLKQFWLTAGVAVAVVLLPAVVILLRKRPIGEAFRAYVKEKLCLSSRKWMGYVKEQRTMMGKLNPQVKKKLPWSRGERIGDPETPNSEQALTRHSSHKEALPSPHTGEESER